MSGGEGGEGAVGVGVELDENQVPNLDAARVAGVDERTLRITRGREIDVQLAARTAGAGVAHHPEIIGLVAVDDVDGGVEPGFLEEDFPMVVRFLVELARLVEARGGKPCVKARGRQSPAAHDQLPGPLDRFLFEIIAEAPVAEHLEKGVVIGVEPDVVEVVMLAPGADAFLGVGGARRSVGGPLLAEEDGHELVHAGVGEEEIRRVGQEGGGGHDGVLFLAKEIEKGLANFGGGHLGKVTVARFGEFSSAAGSSQPTAKNWQLSGSGVRLGLICDLHMKNLLWGWRIVLGVTVSALLASQSARADEQLFGFVRGAETLPKSEFEVYQFTTLRTGKKQGSYYGLDFDTEIEYGFTDQLQASVSVVNHYFNNHGVDGLDDTNAYRFGGFEGAAKYRVLSPFKDPIGLALRLETGYLWHDEVGGLEQSEYYIKPEIDLQKDFFDDTLFLNLDLAAEWAWGKQPAEEYPREFSYEVAAGASYRFAPNWFAGLEANLRSEYPLFDLGFFEHRRVFAGPSIHYAQKRWWATLTYNYQVYGEGVEEDVANLTFAEETRHVVRLKVAFNF